MVDFGEAQLVIRGYYPNARKFLVACSRCDARSEVIEDQILNPLACPRCDIINTQGQPQTQKVVEKHMKVKLVPAHITLPGGVQLFVYLPVSEAPHGCPDCGQ